MSFVVQLIPTKHLASLILVTRRATVNRGFTFFPIYFPALASSTGGDEGTRTPDFRVANATLSL